MTQSERALLRTTLDDLPRNTLLVADAGFTGFAFLSTSRQDDVRPLGIAMSLGGWKQRCPRSGFGFVAAGL